MNVLRSGWCRAFDYMEDFNDMKRKKTNRRMIWATSNFSFQVRSPNLGLSASS